MFFNIFVLIILVIVVSGLLMGLLGMINVFYWMSKDFVLLQLFDMFLSVVFIFLLILIGVSVLKEFGSNFYLGVVIGGIMIYLMFLNLWGLVEVIFDYMYLFGFDIVFFGYQGIVIFVLLVVYVMSKVEKWIRKVVLYVVDLFVIFFVIVIVIGFVVFIVIGFLGRVFGFGIMVVLIYVYDYVGFVVGLIFGGIYLFIVLIGVYYSFYVIEVGFIVDIGKNYLLLIWLMVNVVQGGVGFVVFFMVKKVKIKEIVFLVVFFVFFGIIELVIFGVNFCY